MNIWIENKSDVVKLEKLSFVLVPTSKYYRKHFDERFVESFYHTLNEVEGEIHLLDLFSCDDFEYEDFNDTNHLSEHGARKFLRYISTFWGNCI